MWVVVERGEGRSGDKRRPVLSETVFMHRSEAVAFARSQLTPHIVEHVIPDSGSIFIAYYGEHVAAVRERREDAEADLAKIDYRELVHRICYTIDTESLVFKLDDISCLVDIEAGEHE